MCLLKMMMRHAFSAMLIGGTLAGQAYAAALANHIIDKNGQPVLDAVIFATPLDVPVPAAKTSETVTVAQEKTTFVPYVTVIRMGTSVRFPNHDSYDHHVKSLSPAKTFEARIDAKKAGPKPITFNKVGEVALVCFFHDSMRGFIYVVDTPYFAKTDKSGNAVLTDLPPGRYEVNAWAPSMIGQPLQKTVNVLADGFTNTEFQFDFIPKPAPKPFVPTTPPTY